MPDTVSVEVKPLVGGSSALVARLVLTAPSGAQRQVVFRQHTDRAMKEHTGFVAAKEYHLTRDLALQGLEVPRSLALHPDRTSDGPWLVTEWVEGSTAVDDADVDSALFQMADFLARLHDVDANSINAPGLVRIEDPTKALPKYLSDDETGSVLRRALDCGVQRRPNADVLIHGDFWPGNVMFDQSRLVAVLDWEDAKWGDPLVDLACARVELTCVYGPDASERFTAHYLKMSRHRTGRLLDHDLALWDVYVSATALSTMHLWGLPSRDEAARRAATKRFLDSATNRLIEAI